MIFHFSGKCILFYVFLNLIAFLIFFIKYYHIMSIIIVF